jgi:hypothetical protein
MAQTSILVADLVREIVGPGKITTTEHFLRDPEPDKGRATREAWTWRTDEPPYLEQLREAIHPSGSPGWDEDGALAPSRGSKPGSRWPLRSNALNLMMRLAHESEDLRQDLRASLGDTIGRRVGVEANFREIVGRVGRADIQMQDEILRAIRSLVYACRIVLGYDMPITGVAHACPYCDRTSLRVRSDWSSDVWCGTPDCFDEAGNRPRWPRGQWVFLLDQMNGASA